MRQAFGTIADMIVRSPLVRWTWTGLSEPDFSRTLIEYRPTDFESVREMMAGRYLLASKLVNTEGVSPFAINPGHEGWWQELHGFSWLRHFRDAHDSAERRFALTLVLDWIGRFGAFDAKSWGLKQTALRVMNWLRHLPLILSEASPDQKRRVTQSLGAQIQSLKLRGRLTADPVEHLFAAMALAAAEFCEADNEAAIASRVTDLVDLLRAELDEDGLHKSRNPAQQFEILSELVSLRQSFAQRELEQAGLLVPMIEHMHEALDALTLGTGEPGYFNGCGQLPADLLVVLQGQGTANQKQSRVISGYGVLVEGPSVIIADSGAVPPAPFGKAAHASGLAFEFSHGSELVLGNCGPAPAELTSSRNLFRKGAAHSGPTISGMSTASFVSRGPNAGGLSSSAEPGQIRFYDDEPGMDIETDAFAKSFGVHLKRSLTLLSDGQTLVGQDVMTASGAIAPHGQMTIRFHLAPGAEVLRPDGQDIIRVTLKSGATWTFLWEGGTAQIEESVRQSAYFGFFRTQQIAIECAVSDGKEISWIFTRQYG